MCTPCLCLLRKRHRSLSLSLSLSDKLVETIASTIVNQKKNTPSLFESLIEITSSKFMSPNESEPPRAGKRSADDVWNDIMAGNQQQPKKEMMTLEDFLLNAEIGASSGAAAAVEPKEEGSSGWICDRMNSIGEESMGRARAKRSFSLSAAPHKAAEVRERRMIKNRESAARSRERKQAYEAELEAMAVRLEEENEVLLKEKAEYKKKRLEKLMQSVIPVTEMRRPARILQKTGSM